MSATVSTARPVRRGRAALRLPRGSAEHLLRDRLMGRLDRMAPVALVRALPGYGKTALAAQWAERRAEAGDVVVWIDVTADLNDATGFFERLVDELAEAGLERAGSGGDDGRDHEGQGVMPWHAVADAIGPGTDQPVIVVLDRAHLINDPRLVEGLCALLARAPRLRVVACSRSWHPLRSAAQRAGLDVTLVTARDLTARPAELVSLAVARGHAISSETAEELHRRTGGWLAPSMLILDAAHWPSTSMVVDTARDYLRAVVLPSITDQGALWAAKRLSLAETITAAHLDVLTSTATATAALSGDEALVGAHDVAARLHRAGLVERAPGDRPDSWVIPPLLREVLAVELAVDDPDAVTTWHRAFAHALDEAGESFSVGAALRHARLAADWPFLVTAWLSGAWALVDEHARHLAVAYGGLPGRVVAEHPALGAPRTIASAMARHPRGADAQRAIIEVFRVAAAQGPRSGQGMLPDPLMLASERVLAQSAAIVVERAEGHLAESLAVAARLDKELVEREEAPDPVPFPVSRAWVLGQWAQTLLLAGEVPAATDRAARAFDVAHGPGARVVAASAAAQLSLIHALAGSAGDARRWLEAKTAHDTSDQWNDDIISLPAHLAAALLALDQLERDAAEAAIARSDDSTSTSEMWPFVVHVITQHALLFGDPMIALTRIERLANLSSGRTDVVGAARRILDRCRADLLIALGELNRAQRIVDDAGEGAPWVEVARARIHLVAGDAARAFHVASASVWDPQTTLRDRIDLLFIQAAAAEEMGERDTADRSFVRGSALAARVGTIQPYLLIDARVRQALLVGSGVSLGVHDLARIASAREVYPRRVDLTVLSTRELAVLYEMVRRNTVFDIAKALLVSVNTVKKQISALYGKLGVHDRDTALFRASRLGFLPEPEGSSPEPAGWST